MRAFRLVRRPGNITLVILTRVERRRTVAGSARIARWVAAIGGIDTGHCAVFGCSNYLDVYLGNIAVGFRVIRADHGRARRVLRAAIPGAGEQNVDD